MLNKWIFENRRINHDLKSNIKVFDLSTTYLEIDDLKHIAKRVLISLCDPEDIKFECEGKNLDCLKDYVINHVIPEEDSEYNFYPRKSMWGEILSVEVLKDFRNHLIPIYKLRHKEKRNAAMRSGADAVTCFKQENKLFIALSEVKTKGNIKQGGVYQYRVAIEDAYEHLIENDIDGPEVIDHMKKILRKEGENDNEKYELALSFRDFFQNFRKSNREFHIFMIMEENRWGEDILRMFKPFQNKITYPYSLHFCDDVLRLINKEIALPNILTINILLINNLNELIDETYKLIPEIAKEVVHE